MVRRVAASVALSSTQGPCAKTRVATVAHAVHPEAAPDDVVREHARDVHVRVRRLIREVRRAEEALLLAVERDELDRGVEGVLRHHARQLEHRRDTRGVVVGARRVAREVEDVRAARVEVTADDVGPAGGFGLVTVERRDHVRHVHRVRVPRPGRLREGLLLDGQPPVRGRGVLRELVVDPVRRGADPAVGVGLRRQSVPRPERGERADRVLDVARADVPQHVPDLAGDRRPGAATCGGSRPDGQRDRRRQRTCARDREQAVCQLLHRFLLLARRSGTSNRYRFGRF
jgi:hypothetical protein